MNQRITPLVDDLALLRRDALNGTCILSRCKNRATVLIEGWDEDPQGVCGAHRREVERLGYATYT